MQPSVGGGPIPWLRLVWSQSSCLRGSTDYVRSLAMIAAEEGHKDHRDHGHGHDTHGHTHGLVDPSISSNERGLWAV